jgi:outer membrane protein
MKTSILVALNLLMICSLAFVYFFNRPEKTGFFYNQKIFAEFEGTLHLQKKLDDLKSADKLYLDSIRNLILVGRPELADFLEERAKAFATQEEQLNEQYTKEIWEFLNASIKQYGAQNDYEYIFGATGNGSLMFANEDKDLSKGILMFANSRYRDEKEKQ